MGYRNRGNDGLGWFLRTRGRTMPNSTTVCGDLNLRGIVGIENHAMAPLEVVALDVFPMDAAIGGAVSSSVKTADIKCIGMIGIDGQVVNVLRLGVKSP